MEADVLTNLPVVIATLAILNDPAGALGPSLLPLVPSQVPGFVVMPEWLGDAVRLLFDLDFYRNAAMRLL